MCAEGGEEGGWDGWEADIFEGAAVEGGAGLAFFFFFPFFLAFGGCHDL